MPLVPYPYLDDKLQFGEVPPSVDSAAEKMMEEMRVVVRQERELADKVCFHVVVNRSRSDEQSAKAFVSGLRAYTKHEASYIFRVVDLDFNSLAIGYGLLRLPAMPEVRDWRKRKEAEQKQREQAVAEGKEVEPVEVIGWTDADVDVSSAIYTLRKLTTVGQFCIYLQTA